MLYLFKGPEIPGVYVLSSESRETVVSNFERDLMFPLDYELTVITDLSQFLSSLDVDLLAGSDGEFKICYDGGF
jgi:hypothetical protein